MNEPVLHFNNSNSIYINLIVFNLLKSIAAKKLIFVAHYLIIFHLIMNLDFLGSSFYWDELPL